MQYEELIKKYINKAITRDLTEEEDCYPYIISDNIRIYPTKEDQIKRNVNFLVHCHEASSFAVKFVYLDDFSIYVHDTHILIAHNRENYVVTTADDYFNVSLSQNLTLPFSLLKSIQDDMTSNQTKYIITFFMDGIDEHFK